MRFCGKAKGRACPAPTVRRYYISCNKEDGHGRDESLPYSLSIKQQRPMNDFLVHGSFFVFFPFLRGAQRLGLAGVGA